MGSDGHLGRHLGTGGHPLVPAARRPLDDELPHDIADRRQFHRIAGAAVVSALLADDLMDGSPLDAGRIAAARPLPRVLDVASDGLEGLLRAHEHTSPASISAQVERLRGVLERVGPTLPSRDARRATVLSGRLTVLSADAAFKLGQPERARALARRGYADGEAAGDGPLRGSAREIGAVIEFYDGHPDRALDLARDGQRHVTDGPVASRLVCQEARALAGLGDLPGAARTLDRAYELADRIPQVNWGRPGPSFDTFHPVEVSYNATTALCLLGRPAAAQAHADLAMPTLDRLDAPGFSSVIRLDLALALARRGRLELDRVCALAAEAVTISRGRAVASVSSRADQVLAATRSHSDVREVRDLATQVRDWQRSGRVEGSAGV